MQSDAGMGQQPLWYSQPRSPTLPRTGQFWMFHSLWHLVHAGTVYLGCSCRLSRTPLQPGAARVQSKHNKRIVQRRWWLSVLIKNLFPSAIPDHKRAFRAAPTTKKEE
jgi:hypothetical protein